MGSFSSRLVFHFWKRFKPVMIGRFKRFDGVKLERTRIGSTTTLLGKDKFYVDDNVFIGQYNFIDASNKITIGTGCQITNFCSVLTHSSHKSIRLYGENYGKVGPMIGYGEGEVKIDMYTFIGPHSVIMPNTTIGKGCIVSAYSLVKGDFPDFSVIAGNPAKVIGDTREMDKEYLEKHPDRRENYDSWAK
ncbi:MAG: acyltransferase [Crocinitomicaceae bacterium]|nr:acyltransferase [Crocinitomicaceae bacterium]|tara:strand:- start:169 stop:738 length:570 start_codon:yes stop_codon:yes gene_type:complete